MNIVGGALAQMSRGDGEAGMQTRQDFLRQPRTFIN